MQLLMKAIFIVGPSGSGKTTLSKSLSQIYTQIFGKTTVTLISLDPANYLSQNKDIEINQLITVQDIMQQYQIGPNAAILYAMDFLLQNIQWLAQKIQHRIAAIKNSKTTVKYVNHLFIFDLPGQIQLYINSQSTLKIIQKITKLICQKSGTSPCMLQLFDCTYMHDINQFISLCMMSLSTMINMQIPHINILNKVDLIKSAQNKPNRGLLDQYFKVHSAVELVNQFKQFQYQDENQNQNKQKDKSKVLQNPVDTIAKVIDIYGQVSFMPCSIYKIDLISNLVYEIQRIFGTLEISMHQPKFIQFVKQIDDFSIERAITSLENQFYEEQEQDLQKFQKDLQKQKEKHKQNI